jgi:hypothetical protein
VGLAGPFPNFFFHQKQSTKYIYLLYFVKSYDKIFWEKKETYCHSQPADAIALEISVGEPVAN